MTGPIVQWPDYCPDPDVTIDVTSTGWLTLTNGSKLINYAQFDVTVPDVTCELWRNGARLQVATIAATNGNLTMPGVQVAPNDPLELRFRFISPLSLPWLSRLAWQRSLLFKVPAQGPVQHHFAPNGIRMPVPTLEIAFGWEGTNNKLRVGVTPTSSDNATQQLLVSTRLVNGAFTGTPVSLGNANQQTHDSTFTKAQALPPAESELELWLASHAAPNPRQEDRVSLIFQSADSVPAWDAGTVRLEQTKYVSSSKLDGV